MHTLTELQAEARRLLAALTPLGTGRRLCTWVGSYDDQRVAAQRALDGDTVDLEMMLDMDAAELWLRPEYEWDDWIDQWQPTASESTVPPMGCAA